MWILWGIIQILSLAGLSSQVLTSWMMISNMAPCALSGRGAHMVNFEQILQILVQSISRKKDVMKKITPIHWP